MCPPAAAHENTSSGETTCPAASQPLLELSHTAEAGRFYVAGREVTAGEQLLQVEPEAATVDESFVTRVCAFCLRESRKGVLKVICKHCQYVAYCSEACRSAAVGIHDVECVALGRLRKQKPRLNREASTHLRLLLQIMYRRWHLQARRGGQEDITESLHAGREEFQAQKGWNARRKSYQAITHAFAAACGYDIHWTPFEVEDVLGAIICNGFGVWDHDKNRCLGLSICVAASMFNHSCAPNVVRLNRGRDLQFYALGPVAKGEPLCISYIDPRLEIADRRARLDACYGFLCRCPRCTEGVELPRMCHKHLGYFIGASSGKTWCSACSA